MEDFGQQPKGMRYVGAGQLGFLDLAAFLEGGGEGRGGGGRGLLGFFVLFFFVVVVVVFCLGGFYCLTLLSILSKN